MASNHKIEIIVGLKDLATNKINSIQKAAGNIGKGFQNSGSYIKAFNGNLDSTIKKIDSMATSMYKFNMYTADLQRNLKNIATIGAVATGALAYNGMQKTLDFDYKSHMMQSRMETNSSVRKNIEDYVLNDLNLKVAFNPSQIMDMGVTLGQGGVNTAPDMKAMMKTVSYFSEAVDAVPDQAAEMVIAAAKGFGISMGNSSQITDKLTVALNKSLLGVEEMPHAIGELAGRANMYGQGLDSSLVALMTMRDQGMGAAQGSQDLLHALRQASRIGNNDVLFKRTSGYFDKLGVNDAIFNKDTRKLKEYPELIGDVEKAMIKSGNTNPKYNIKNEKDYQNFLSKNKGVAPADFWDSMKAMPLITKVFGAAGMAPILMGLQSKYEKVNKKTGEKTGEVLYGSAALKESYKDVKNSNGAVDDTHKIIADSGQYQLQVLSGAWQAAQIKFLDGMVPVLKEGAKGLTSFLSGGKSGTSTIKDFEKAVSTAAKNFEKEGNPAMANFVQTSGNIISGGAKISKTMPSMGKQFGDAFNDNIVKGDWGSGIISFPWSIVKNGIGFITDILKANKQFNDAVSKLPKNLQNPAKLIETVTKGGAVLLLGGVIVKIVELALRSASATLKGLKLGTSLTKTIIDMLTGNKKGGKGGGLGGLLGKNMNINANIVNVNGKVVNNGGGPDFPDGGGKNPKPKGGNPKSSLPRTILNGGKNLAKNPAAWGALAVAGYTAAAGYGWSKWDGSYGGTNAKAIRGQVTPKRSDTKIISDIAKQNSITSKNVAGLSKYVNNLAKGKNNSKNDGKYPVARLEKILSNSEKNANGWKDPVAKIAAGVNGVTTATANGANKLAQSASEVSGSVVSGFATANDRLQNIKLQNNTTVNVAPPSVSISGNIKQYLNVASSGPKSFNYANAKTPAGKEIARRMGLYK